MWEPGITSGRAGVQLPAPRLLILLPAKLKHLGLDHLHPVTKTK